MWSLQNFLQAEGVFPDEPTGFFGPLTERALQTWQSREGIVSAGSVVSTGWGVVGPRTRLMIKNRCVAQDALVASPRTGIAPLTVTLTMQLKSAPSGTYTLDFGDGSSQAVSPTMSMSSVQHTYTKDGSYRATLTQNTPGGCAFGGQDQGGCIGLPASSRVIGVTTLIVGPIAASAPPIITSINAPSTLRVGQTGTWRVNTAIQSGDATFSVMWGDESVYEQLEKLAAATGTVQNHATFTHAYRKAGTYNPRFTATNPKGSTSASYPVTVVATSTGGGGGQ